MNPVLFILMRTDLDSMNPGKAMAQAAHSANVLETHYERFIQEETIDVDASDDARAIMYAWTCWKWGVSQGFGTTIVLGASMSKIKTDLEWLEKSIPYRAFLSGIVHDPTYPLIDGSVTHLIPLDTCGYIFAPDKDNEYLRVILDEYELHP